METKNLNELYDLETSEPEQLEAKACKKVWCALKTELTQMET
jgi:hypothetical protein